MQKGADKDQFLSVLDYFIYPLLENTQFKLDHFFVVPSNHDINREAIIDEYQEEQGSSP